MKRPRAFTVDQVLDYLSDDESEFVNNYPESDLESISDSEENPDVPVTLMSAVSVTTTTTTVDNLAPNPLLF